MIDDEMVSGSAQTGPPVDERNNRERVLDKYPDAQSVWMSRGWRVITNTPCPLNVIGATHGGHVPEQEAWDDAASRLPTPAPSESVETMFAAQTRESPDRESGSSGPDSFGQTGGISCGIGEPDGTSLIPSSGHGDDSDICAAKIAEPPVPEAGGAPQPPTPSEASAGNHVWVTSYTASKFSGALSRGLRFRSIHDSKEAAEKMAHDPQAEGFSVTEYAPLSPIPAAQPVPPVPVEINPPHPTWCEECKKKIHLCSRCCTCKCHIIAKPVPVETELPPRIAWPAGLSAQDYYEAALIHREAQLYAAQEEIAKQKALYVLLEQTMHCSGLVG